MVEMIMGDDSWYVVRNTPGVTGFVGSGSKPIPLQEEEIQNILKHMGMEEVRPKVQFRPGQSIRVNSGPFAGFIGMVEEVMFDRNKLRVLVSMFGRETPVELEYSQADEL
jgi:transcriptional antiterminator NusG